MEFETCVEPTTFGYGFVPRPLVPDDAEPSDEAFERWLAALTEVL